MIKRFLLDLLAGYFIMVVFLTQIVLSMQAKKYDRINSFRRLHRLNWKIANWVYGL